MFCNNVMRDDPWKLYSFNFQKVFDKVPHIRLLEILKLMELEVKYLYG